MEKYSWTFYVQATCQTLDLLLAYIDGKTSKKVANAVQQGKQFESDAYFLSWRIINYTGIALCTLVANKKNTK